MLALIRFNIHMRFEVLVQRTLVAHGFVTNVTGKLL